MLGLQTEDGCCCCTDVGFISVKLLQAADYDLNDTAIVDRGIPYPNGQRADPCGLSYTPTFHDSPDFPAIYDYTLFYAEIRDVRGVLADLKE